jgi:hypothetical protein
MKRSRAGLLFSLRLETMNLKLFVAEAVSFRIITPPFPWDFGRTCIASAHGAVNELLICDSRGE